MTELYNCSEYKDFLRFQIQQHKSETGYKGRLSEAAGFNPSFLSHVLKSHVHITPDHAVKLARFWRLTADAEEFLLTLVLRERAATPELRAHLQNKLNTIKNQSDELKDSLPPTENLTAEQESTYFSSWHWSAIHILAGVPGHATAEEIAKRLALPRSLVLHSLQVLQEMGLVRNNSGQWAATDRPIHAKKNAPYNWLHQSSWRNQGMADLMTSNPQSLHYTGVHSLSREDVLRLRKELIQFLEAFHKKIAASKEETISCLNLDFFEIRSEGQV